MTATVEIANEQELMARLWELRLKNQRVLKGISRGGDIISSVVATAVFEFSQEWQHAAPYLTHTLQSATRGEVDGGEGSIHIDPGVTNPVFGGKPSIYGPIVHNRQPWVSTLVASHSQRIMTNAGRELFARLDEVYQGG